MAWVSVAKSIKDKVPSIAKMGFGIFQNSQANQINPEWHQYMSSPYAMQQLQTAQQAYNGRMAGAAQQEQNIASSQAAANDFAARNATDSSQLLALAQASQGQSNAAYNNLAIQEAQNKYNLLGNLNAGYQAMVNEGNKVYQSQLDKYQMDTAQQAAVRNAAWQNIFGGMNDYLGAEKTAEQGQKTEDFNNQLLALLGK